MTDSHSIASGAAAGKSGIPPAGQGRRNRPARRSHGTWLLRTGQQERRGLPWWARYGVVLTLIALIITFSFSASGFATAQNWRIIGGSNSTDAIVALGALLPLMAGEFDLSVGAVLEVGSVLVAVLVGREHFPLAIAIVLTLVMAAGIGAINGILIAFFGISSFIATLATSSVLAGVSLYLTSGQVLFTGIPRSLISFSQGNVGGVPELVIVAAAVTVLLWYLTEQTPAGRRFIAVGLGKEATRLMGMRTQISITVAFVASALLSACAGMLELGRVGSASSGIGPIFLLPALAAGFLGATTIKVGRFNVFGTVIAVILVAVGLSGLELLGAPSWVEPVFDGGVLLAAVSASRLAVLRSREPA